MEHIFKITSKNEWKNYRPILITLAVFIVVSLIMFYYRSPEDNFWDAFPYFAIGFLMFFIPLCIIHLRYYSINEGMEMTYDDLLERIAIKDTKKGIASEFHLDDIKYIFHTMTALHWFPWDNYNYSDIFLKNGKQYRITSLMVYRLSLPVGEKYQVITTFFPYPSSSD